MAVAKNETSSKFPQQNVVEPSVKSFKKALEIYEFQGYIKFSIQKLYLAKVFWCYEEGGKNKERCLGACFCSNYLFPTENGYEFKHLILPAFGEEDNIMKANRSQARIIPIKEGDLFDCNNGTYKLLHGKIIQPKDVMDLDTAVEVFAESGLIVTKDDVKVARLGYRIEVPKTLDNPKGEESRTIGVCFLTETTIDCENYVAFVKAYHGKNSRIAEFVPRSRCSYHAFGSGDSFNTSSGEWMIIDGKLRSHEAVKWARLAAARK